MNYPNLHNIYKLNNLLRNSQYVFDTRADAELIISTFIKTSLQCDQLYSVKHFKRTSATKTNEITKSH